MHTTFNSYVTIIYILIHFRWIYFAFSLFLWLDVNRVFNIQITRNCINSNDIWVDHNSREFLKWLRESSAVSWSSWSHCLPIVRVISYLPCRRWVIFWSHTGKGTAGRSTSHGAYGCWSGASIDLTTVFKMLTFSDSWLSPLPSNKTEKHIMLCLMFKTVICSAFNNVSDGNISKS